MRPNYAQDAPPAVITVGGVDYTVDTDFRTWIDVLGMMKDLVTCPTTIDHVRQNAEVLTNIENAVFGHIVPHPANEVLEAITGFLQGYPEAPRSESGSTTQTYSFDYDLNYIIVAIRNQSGIDLSYRRKEPFHWWEFLLEFHALCGDHYILRLMEIRGYNGKDPEMKRQALRFALPRVTTADDQAMLDEFDVIFYNA